MSTPANAESQGGTLKNVQSGGQQGDTHSSGTGSLSGQGGSASQGGLGTNQQGGSSSAGGASSSNASGGKDHLANK